MESWDQIFPHLGIWSRNATTIREMERCGQTGNMCSASYYWICLKYMMFMWNSFMTLKVNSIIFFWTDFDYKLKKPIASRYGSGMFQRYLRSDGVTFNVSYTQIKYMFSRTSPLRPIFWAVISLLQSNKLMIYCPIVTVRNVVAER